MTSTKYAKTAPLFSLATMLVVSAGTSRAADAPTLTCLWQDGSSIKIACQGLTDLDASKPYTVKITNAPNGVVVVFKVDYGSSASAAQDKRDCPLNANGFYACPARTDNATSIKFLVAINGASPVLVLSGATKAVESSPTPPKIDIAPPLPVPLAQYDTNVQGKVASVLTGDYQAHKLQEGDGYLFNYTSAGRALIVLNSRGVPLRPIPDVIDETDEISVVVVDWKEFMSDVTISVSGCDRSPVDVRIFGEPPSPGGVKSSVRRTADDLGQPLFKTIGKCAGSDTGGPTVTVKTNIGQQNETSGGVTIPVNPVYRLTVGVGLGADFTRSTSFGVATVPGSTVATIIETDDRIGLSSLIFVGWYPWGRDFRKVDVHYFLQRLELFVALDPKAIDQSAIIGGGINLVTGMELLVGWRALNKQVELQPDTGLAVGSPFDGPTSSLPTTKVWSTGGLFVGVGVTNALLAKLH